LNTKSPENATKEELIAKVREAAKYVDINQLCISGQCGFASSQHGNVIAQEDQDKKIKLLVEVAKELWGDV
jgi:5-methyltetrahydropteroyltriglutamate--homocysteine methyltransferase